MATWRLLPSINSLCTRRLALQDPAVSKFKSTTEQLALPPRPKKPLTVYAQYVQNTFSKLQQENPTSKNRDIMKKISEHWALVDQDIKLKLQTQYSEQYNIYKKKLKDYHNSLTDEQRKLVDKTSKKSKVEIPGKPKKPLSVFFLYMNNMKSTKNPNEQYATWLSRMSTNWHNLAPEIKNKYQTEWKQLNETYMIELKKWKENMDQTSQSKSKDHIDSKKYVQ